MKVNPGDQQTTAICTSERLFEFNVIPFGLCNAPATFKGYRILYLLAFIGEIV